MNWRDVFMAKVLSADSNPPFVIMGLNEISIITWLRHIIVWQLNDAKQMALNILRNTESAKKHY